MNKRGLSDIITTVLIILIALAAIVLIWAFIRGFLMKSGTQINVNSFSESFDVPLSSVNMGNESISFSIKRTAGTEIVTGIVITLEDSDGKVVPITINDSYDVLQSRVYSFNYTELGLKDVYYISVAPIYSGKMGSIVKRVKVNEVKIEYLEKESANPDENIEEWYMNGLVLWYKFEDYSARDYSPMGNNGSLFGDIELGEGATDGEYIFDGVNDYIIINSFNGFSSTQGTLCVWAQPYEQITPYTHHHLVGYGNGFNRHGNDGRDQSFFIAKSNDGYWLTSTWGEYNDLRSTELVDTTKQSFICSTLDSNNLSLYVDGLMSGNMEVINSLNLGKGIIGADLDSMIYEFFYGSIDEVYIFNRTLSSSEIYLLYENEEN